MNIYTPPAWSETVCRQARGITEGSRLAVRKGWWVREGPVLVCPEWRVSIRLRTLWVLFSYCPHERSVPLPELSRSRLLNLILETLPAFIWDEIMLFGHTLALKGGGGGRDETQSESENFCLWIWASCVLSRSALRRAAWKTCPVEHLRLVQRRWWRTDLHVSEETASSKNRSMMSQKPWLLLVPLPIRF